MAPKHSLFSTDVAALSLRTLGSNSRLNLVARTLLMVFSLITAALAVVYVVVRSKAIVDILLKPRIPGDEIAAPAARPRRAGAAARRVRAARRRSPARSCPLAQPRRVGAHDGLDQPPAARGRGRGVGARAGRRLRGADRHHPPLHTCCCGSAARSSSSASACSASPRSARCGAASTSGPLGMGVTSLGGAMWAAASGVPANVAHDAANIVQIQLIVTAAHRQISLLESDAFAALNDRKTTRRARTPSRSRTRQRIEQVMTSAIAQIERYTDPQPVPAANVVERRPPLRARRLEAPPPTPAGTGAPRGRRSSSVDIRPPPRDACTPPTAGSNR